MSMEMIDAGAAFTLKLKTAIEYTGGHTEVVNGIMKLTGGDIGIQHYPIFDEAYRDTLTGKIIDHYWNREIGFETIDIFKMKMRTRMNEIMPIYNKLYLSEAMIVDPLRTVDMKTVATGESNQEVTADGDAVNGSESVSETRAVQSDTPQTMLAGDKDYATSAADSNTTALVESTSAETNHSVSDTTNSNDAHVTGYQGSQAELIMRYRESFLNIDLMIIRDLEELFMLVYDHGDTYTNTERAYF